MLSGGYLPISSTSARMREQVKPFLLGDEMIKFCKKCNQETEHYENGRCKICRSAYSKAYNAANPEKMNAFNLASRTNYPERKRAWSESNPDYFRIYYAKNRKERNIISRAWKKANPDKVREMSRNRRARKRNADGTHSSADIRGLLILQRSKCACCKISIDAGYHVDHIYPLSKGGSNDKLNLQLLCPLCNTQKHAKHPIEFMQSKGFLL